MSTAAQVVSNLLRTIRPLHNENHFVTRDNVLIALMELRGMCDEDRRPPLTYVCEVMNRKFFVRWTPSMLPKEMLRAKERLAQPRFMSELERLEREYSNGKNKNGTE